MSGEGEPLPQEFGGVALLERAIAYTLGSLRLVTGEALSAPTPCLGWDLRTLLAHMEDSLDALQEAADDGWVRTAGPPAGERRRQPSRSRLSGDLRDVRDVGDVGDLGDLPYAVVGLRDRACRLLGSWAANGDAGTALVGGRPLRERVLTGAGAVEIAAHGWDVAQACGLPRPLPAALARDLLRCAEVVLADVDRPSLFAPALAAETEAGWDGLLLAYLGRAA